MHVSLVRGPVPPVVVVLAIATLAGTVIRRQPGWRATIARELMLAAAAMAVLHFALRRTGAIPYRYPTSFYAWWGLTVFAALVARAGWRRASPARRLASVGAVVATAALAATLINLHYDFYPTLAGIFGRVSQNERNPAGLAHLETEAWPTGDSRPTGRY